VTRLAAVTVSLLISAGCAGSHHQSAARLHHHYFLVGKLACKHLVVSTPDSVEFLVLNVTGYPAKYQHDVAAGCKADG
jgi:hypothetical protein